MRSGCVLWQISPSNLCSPGRYTQLAFIRIESESEPESVSESEFKSNSTSECEAEAESECESESEFERECDCETQKNPTGNLWQDIISVRNVCFLAAAVGEWQRVLPAGAVVATRLLHALPQKRVAKSAGELCAQDHRGLHHLQARLGPGTLTQHGPGGDVAKTTMPTSSS